MVVHANELIVETTGRSLVDVTADVNRRVRGSGIREGLCNVFIRHTSASLIVGENADPEVLRDLERFMSGLVPDGDPRYRHTDEGPDDMPAHVRSVLTTTSVNLPVSGSSLALGTWQALFVWEHRRRPHRRTLTVSVLGE